MTSCDHHVTSAGPLQGSCDSLAYKILINTEMLQSYISLLMETQWLVVMGTKGTCKTSLAQGLSRHLMQLVGDEGEEGGDVVIINYNVEKDGLEVWERGREEERARARGGGEEKEKERERGEERKREGGGGGGE